MYKHSTKHIYQQRIFGHFYRTDAAKVSSRACLYQFSLEMTSTWPQNSYSIEFKFVNKSLQMKSGRRSLSACNMGVCCRWSPLVEPQSLLASLFLINLMFSLNFLWDCLVLNLISSSFYYTAWRPLNFMVHRIQNPTRKIAG